MRTLIQAGRCSAIYVFLDSSAFAQSNNEVDVAVLYRSSVVTENARYHIATFDADEKAYGGSKFDYNWENCLTAAKLFQAQPFVQVVYWCEKGFYRQ